MNLHNFIYAAKGPQRYYRHILFWSARYAFNVLSDILGTFLLNDSYVFNAADFLRYTAEMGCEMLYTYCVAYAILPRFFLKKKRLPPILLLVGFTIGIEALSVFIDHRFDPTGQPLDLSILGLWGMLSSYTGYGPPAVCAVFVIIKTIKNYNRTMEEKETLIRENAEAEALLLKNQVHPHFLFNTLNNIYSFALGRSRVALRLIESLSSTIRYMITDCSADFVPLAKEINMIRDYIQLEKVRYTHRLNTELRVHGNPENKFIAPLFLIPLVENCFKHGASRQLGDPWVKLLIFIEGPLLRVEISNSKPPSTTGTEKKGIGLSNVRKRLQLLYPGNHSFEICPAIESFTIHMEVPLHTVLAT